MLGNPEIVAGGGVVGGDIRGAVAEGQHRLTSQGGFAHLARTCEYLQKAPAVAKAGDDGIEKRASDHIESKRVSAGGANRLQNTLDDTTNISADQVYLIMIESKNTQLVE
jgi:hypothetical protein